MQKTSSLGRTQKAAVFRIKYRKEKTEAIHLHAQEMACRGQGNEVQKVC
jgi:hypothetical protein